jgi:hypothetical protein
MVARYEKGRTRADRYERIVIEGVWYLVHHLIWIWHFGDIDELRKQFVMDHENWDKLDNRIENLRWVTDSENNHYNMKRALELESAGGY